MKTQVGPARPLGVGPAYNSSAYLMMRAERGSGSPDDPFGFSNDLALSRTGFIESAGSLLTRSVPIAMVSTFQPTR